MDRVKVVLFGEGLPRMLAELLGEVLSRGTDLHVEWDGANPAESLTTVMERVDATVAIMGADQASPAQVCQLLERRSHTKVFAVAGDGRDVLLFEMRPHRVQLGQVSPQQLVTLVNAAARDCIDLLDAATGK